MRNSIRRMKYLELAFYSNSVYISDKPLYAERGIVQLNASPESTAGYACFVSPWTDQSDMRILRPYPFWHCKNMSKSDLTEVGWLIPR